MTHERLPTNAPDPEPGFDAELTELAPEDVYRSSGNDDASLSLRLTVEGESADKLRRIAQARGQRPSDVIADLLRSA